MMRIALMLIFIICHSTAQATHIYSGQIKYSYIKTNGNMKNYKITLTLLRDCTHDHEEPPVPFDKEVNLCLFKKSGTGKDSLLTSYIVKLNGAFYRKPVFTACSNEIGYCTEEGYYETSVWLNVQYDSVLVKWERCCRVESENLSNDSTNSPSAGMNYYTSIPLGIENSSVFANTIKNVYQCSADTFATDLQFSDPDGDSLVYYPVGTPDGASTINPIPDCRAKLTPISFVKYKDGFEADKPFGAAGYYNVNRNNGLVYSAIPRFGKYCTGIGIEEWRNGQKINTTIFDILFFRTDSAGLMMKTTDVNQTAYIYPNPVNDELNINFKDLSYWAITSTDGKIIDVGKSCGPLKLNTSAYRQGVYLLSLTGARYKQNYRFIVQH